LVADPGLVVTAGPVTAEALRELDALAASKHVFQGTLTQMAVRLARAYDEYDGADLTKLARLNQELRQTLAALTEVGDDGDDGEAARMSTPVRHAEVAGAADVGAADRGGRGPAG
jgi:hypothetical protein